MHKPDQTAVYQNLMHKGKIQTGKHVHNHMDYWILLCTMKINMSCSMSSTVNVIAIVKSLQKNKPKPKKHSETSRLAQLIACDAVLWFSVKCNNILLCSQDMLFNISRPNSCMMWCTWIIDNLTQISVAIITLGWQQFFSAQALRAW